MKLNDLPNDILLVLFSLLDDKSLSSLRLVNKFMCGAVDSAHWKISYQKKNLDRSLGNSSISKNLAIIYVGIPISNVHKQGFQKI